MVVATYHILIIEKSIYSSFKSFSNQISLLLYVLIFFFPQILRFEIAIDFRLSDLICD